MTRRSSWAASQKGGVHSSGITPGLALSPLHFGSFPERHFTRSPYPLFRKSPTCRSLKRSSIEHFKLLVKRRLQLQPRGLTAHEQPDLAASRRAPTGDIVRREWPRRCPNKPSNTEGRRLSSTATGRARRWSQGAQAEVNTFDSLREAIQNIASSSQIVQTFWL